MRQHRPRHVSHGDSSGLAALALKQFSAGLQRYLLRRTRGRQDAEDLAQEIYLRLLRVGDASQIKCPQAYVYRVAVNVLNEFNLHQQRGAVAYDSLAIAETDLPADEIDSPEEVYERRRLQQRLAAMVEQLSPMQKAVFLLAKHRDMSHADIAAHLGISINTARVHLHRAICHCRRALAEDGELRHDGQRGRS